MNEQKLIKLLEFYKQYKALSGYIDKKYNLKVLEDGAQGFGGHIEIDGKINRACSFGDASTTSFFPAKPLGCYGDGGAIFVDDEDLKKAVNKNPLSNLKI